MPDTTSDPHDGGHPMVVLTKEEYEASLRQVGHDVGRVHRRRVAIQCFCVSLVLCALGSWFALREIKQSDDARARYDCQLVRALALPLGDFVATSTRARQKQTNQNFTPVLLHDLERIIPLTQLQRLSRASTATWTIAAARWQTVDLPPLQRLQHLDCLAANPPQPPTRLKPGGSPSPAAKPRGRQ